jgi:hypothetical protein
MDRFINSTSDRQNDSSRNEPSNMQSNFSFSKGSMNYNLIIKSKPKTIDINVRRVMGSANYEGIFTLEDLKETAHVFYFYKKLEEIYIVLVQKLNETNVDFEFEEDKVNLKFTFSVDSQKMHAILQLNKGTEENLPRIVDDVCKTVLANSEAIRELQGKHKDGNLPEGNPIQLNYADLISALDKKYQEIIANQENKFQKIISALGNKIEILEKNMKNQEEEIINIQENVISIQDNPADELKNSKIVKNVERNLIKKWIDSTNNNKVSFKLLYRATEHGKLNKDFHTRCDCKVS